MSKWGLFLEALRSGQMTRELQSKLGSSMLLRIPSLTSIFRIRKNQSLHLPLNSTTPPPRHLSAGVSPSIMPVPPAPKLSLVPVAIPTGIPTSSSGFLRLLSSPEEAKFSLGLPCRFADSVILLPSTGTVFPVIPMAEIIAQMFAGIALQMLTAPALTMPFVMSLMAL